MASINIAFCEASIDENRRIAKHLRAQAEAAIAELPSIKDDDRRCRIANGLAQDKYASPKIPATSSWRRAH